MWSVKVTQLCPTLWDPMDHIVHGILQARILEWVGSLSLLHGSFPTQGLKAGLPHCRWILYQLSHKGSKRTLEWVTYPFSSGSSQPRNPTGSPALQVDSLPAELWGKPVHWYNRILSSYLKKRRVIIYWHGKTAKKN